MAAAWTPLPGGEEVNVKKLTLMALLLAAALTVFVIEAHIPPPVPIAGVKLGLANVVTLAAMVWLGRREALTILTLRVILGSVFTGQAVSFLYSMGGGLLCFAAMSLALRLLGRQRLWAVSVFGALFHNLGQILVAALLTGSAAVFAYLPALVISGVVTGVFTGLTAQFVTSRLKPGEK